MLDYLVRTLPVALRARSRRRAAPLVSRLRRRVGLRQIDVNLHMNQAVYAQVLELGRTELLLASGAYGSWRERGINPILAEQTIVYRRELRPLVSYEVDTRAVGVEGRLLVTESHVLVGERVFARGLAKMILVGRDGVLAPQDVPPLVEPYLVEALSVEDWRLV